MEISSENVFSFKWPFPRGELVEGRQLCKVKIKTFFGPHACSGFVHFYSNGMWFSPCSAS